jgi:hypothetical protein
MMADRYGFTDAYPTSTLAVDDGGVHLEVGSWGIARVRPEAVPWLDGRWLSVPWNGIGEVVEYPLGVVIRLPEDDSIAFLPLRVLGHGLGRALAAHGVPVGRRWVPLLTDLSGARVRYDDGRLR